MAMELEGPATTLLVVVGLLIHLAGSSTPPTPVVCARGTSDCTVTNAYGSFPDRATSRAASVTYPSTEEELVAAVAAAAAAGRKVKVATRYSHSLPKLACPGGRDGIIISTLQLNSTVRLDAAARMITVESGVLLRDLLRAAASAGLALPHSPYWSGVTIGGLLATGAHGSSLWGKGGAVHEYVVGLRIVTPAPASQGFAEVRELGAQHPDLGAAKVSLGVLGVVSQVTLALQPLFKRSVTFLERDDSDLEDQVAAWGGLHEFGDLAWQPGRGKVVYRQDDRVDVSSPGNGLNDHPTLRSRAAFGRVGARRAEELLEENGTDIARCEAAAAAQLQPQPQPPHGFTNDGDRLMHRQPGRRAPHLLQVGPSPRGYLYLQFGHQRPSRQRRGVRRRREAPPGPQPTRVLQPGREGRPTRVLPQGVVRLPRQARGRGGLRHHVLPELHRRRAPSTRGRHRRARADGTAQVWRLPALGKNRNFAFDGAVGRYPKAGEFLEVKGRYDPDGLFSSEWSDQVLGINRTSPSVDKEGCAMEGLCVCSDDSHCAPERGYLCRPGKVYKEARVCSSSFQPAAGALRDEL